MPPGTEGYRCVRRTFDEDVLIQAIKPISPIGTHHVLVGLEDPGESALPDGDAPCTAADVGSRLIFGSGVGTGEVTMPAGTAIAIPAGTQIVINLHIFNVSSDELEGTSGFRFLPAAPGADPRRWRSCWRGPTSS